MYTLYESIFPRPHTTLTVLSFGLFTTKPKGACMLASVELVLPVTYVISLVSY